ncbi:MAG: prepilin-type N-terminal cleavage/methylation domain-containing protein [Pseudomonadota bacterium]|nr:MAG: prepilin-type N-terminal cleavage/methylation domain-containing protein [Pseudomonadota bacterium]
MTKANQIQGLTLIEMMVTIAVLGIIAAIAIPAYTGYIATARMTEGQNEIAAIRLAQEEFFLENNTYFGPVASDATGNTLKTDSGSLYSPSSQGYTHFSYAITAGPCGNIAQCYTITATGKAGTSMDGETISADGP